MDLGSFETRRILQPLINEGNVNYQKLAEQDWLPRLVQEIQETNPNQLYRNEALAFWINAYNILTLNAVLEKIHNNPDWEGITSH